MLRANRPQSIEAKLIENQEGRSVGSITTRKGRQNERFGDSVVSQTLKKHILNAETCYENFAKSQLARARRQRDSQSLFASPSGLSAGVSSALSTTQIRKTHENSPFPNSSSSENLSFAISTETSSLSFQLHGPDNRPRKVSHVVQVIKYRDQEVDVPAHTYHVQLQRNMVTENNKKLNFNPNDIQFDDPQWSLEEYEDEIKEHFPKGTLEQRAKPLKFAESSKYLRPFILKALEELGCSPAAILRYLIDPFPKTTLKQKQRDLANREGFGPLEDEDKWAMILSKLSVSNEEEQLLAEEVCQVFESLTKFSIWYLVKGKCADVWVQTPKYPIQPSGLCRLCFRFSCTTHGEFSEELKHATKKARTANYAFNEINYRTSINLPNREVPDRSIKLPLDERRQSYKYWQKKLKILVDLDKESPVNYARGHFYPCHHSGPCKDNNCSCFKAGINCEKFCGCSASCSRRFPGCNCAREGRTCSPERCLCRKMDRECDPDVCTKCGAAEMLQVHDKEKELALVRRCTNVGIQRGIPKRLLLGTSQVSGFGLFVGEAVDAGDFLAEYKGELISKGEASRRQILHQYLREYLFELNEDQQIDSLYAGNKLRFINNACKPENINCDPIPMFCNGAIRMGLFATRNLKPGEELFFKYGYTEQQLEGYKEPTTKQPTLSKSAGQTRRVPRRVIEDSEGSAGENDDLL